MHSSHDLLDSADPNGLLISLNLNGDLFASALCNHVNAKIPTALRDRSLVAHAAKQSDYILFKLISIHFIDSEKSYVHGSSGVASHR